MLHGRVSEQWALDGRLSKARTGCGGGVVLRGDPGIGKSALLAYARRRADEMHVLEAAGLEAEASLGYATLHQLLWPVLDRIQQLPEPQAQALGVVFGRHEGPTPDRFLVSLASLSLLSELAGDRPVLCLVDDAHWADRPSLEVLTFLGRRLAVEPIVLLMAARVGEGAPVDTAGLDELSLTGLAREPARALLSEHGGNQLTRDEREQLLVASGGNPLAIREFARSGLHPNATGEPMPLTEGLLQAFRARVRQQDPATRQLLLLIAVSGGEQGNIVRQAAAALGLSTGPLRAENLAELVVDGAQPRFRHPLIRSAVYQDAKPRERRAAHRAMAEALTDEPTEQDRRAWHLANAAESADEAVALELERSAERAHRLAGPAAAAIALERAADLSPAHDHRQQRLVAAAAAWLQAGATPQATALLDGVEASSKSLADDIAELRALIALRTGMPSEAVALLSEIIPNALHGDRSKAIQLLLLLGEAGFMAGAPRVWPRIAAAAGELTAPTATAEDLVVRLLQAVHSALAGDGAGLSEREIVGLVSLDDPYALVSAGGMVSMIGHYELARWLRERATRRARKLGAAGSLAWILISRVVEELLAGRFQTAQAYAEEGYRLAEETSQPNTACCHQSLLALLAANLGRQSDTKRLAEESLTQATVRNLPDVAAWARHALGLNDLVAGRAGDALRQLEAMSRPGAEPTRVVLRAVPDLVEAAVRAGEPDRTDAPLVRFDNWARGTGTPELLALSARCHALLAKDDEGTESEFAAALELHARAGWPMETARTQLLLGEHLRRKRRRADARGPLNQALEAFTRLGAAGWADRARAELRASGEPSSEPASSAIASLTAQELRIAVAISEGATNREVAAQLFLSPRTVDYHLRKVFNKLGIASRAELVRIVLTGQEDGSLPATASTPYPR
ncbi:LuxR family transcriptional regulator [Pseudonocardia eucalypti]|uniref:LuxR family transcriptional regulator n=1 Tax=Pseudonocardia eucalypti TaxID=648755 RepID=A0ABP9QCI8_9PSEU|nr:DNA-binding NarL/FixJ family response regulator [Pseudonocardia eucalypti]